MSCLKYLPHVAGENAKIQQRAGYSHWQRLPVIDPSLAYHFRTKIIRNGFTVCNNFKVGYAFTHKVIIYIIHK